MSIYLPGAYSDKSVIAAEASERVARRRRHHHQHLHQHHCHESHIAFAISTPHRGTQRHKHDALAFGATRERDTPKSAVLARRERQRRTVIQTDEEQWRKWQSREREILNAA